jgi:hypothetical protein
MKLAHLLPAIALSVLAIGCDDDDPAGPGESGTMSFFVSSAKSTTGNLGGLAAADARCQSLAAAAGAGAKTWRAYLSVEQDASGQPVEARSRIGTGPWFNAAGVRVAQNLDDLHSRRGDAAVFLDERGARINGQWTGSPSPNEHDILTGSTADGRVMAGLTCGDWTSAAANLAAQVGHSDGLGPGGDSSGSLSSWSSSHPN